MGGRFRQPGEDMLFLIHGLGVDHRMWVFQQRRLTRDYHIKAPDLPGFGENPPPENTAFDPLVHLADFVADEIKSSGADKVNLCGYSMGGTLALMVALRNPGLVDSLALVCSSPCWGGGRKWVRGLTLGPLALLSASFLGFGMRAGVYRHLKGEADRNLLLDMLGKADKYFSARLLKSLFAVDLRPRLGEIKVPTLIIGGERDLLAPVSHQRFLHQGIEGSSLALIPGAGHYYCIQKPDDFASRLADFERGIITR
ncbi:alpha/beta hydrolase [bacterium]|nr:MAG: alpha/beta hydrolase [bacterium]